MFEREHLDALWYKALDEAVNAGEKYRRYHFANLIAAAEREAVIAQAIEQGFISESYAEQFRAAIRARGEPK